MGSGSKPAFRNTSVAVMIYSTAPPVRFSECAQIFETVLQHHLTRPAPPVFHQGRLAEFRSRDCRIRFAMGGAEQELATTTACRTAKSQMSNGRLVAFETCLAIGLDSTAKQTQPAALRKTNCFARSLPIRAATFRRNWSFGLDPMIACPMLN